MDLQGINLAFFGNKFGLCGSVNIVSRINYDDVQRLKIAPLSASLIYCNSGLWFYFQFIRHPAQTSSVKKFDLKRLSNIYAFQCQLVQRKGKHLFPFYLVCKTYQDPVFLRLCVLF